MSRILNAIPRENAADYRKVLNKQPLKRVRTKGPKALVSQYHAFDPKRGTHTLQLPIYFESFTYNAMNDTYYVKVNGKRYPRSKRSDAAKAKRKDVWDAMKQYMPTFARCIPEGIDLRVKHIEWIRLGLKELDDDNLQTAFKSVRDALCSFLVWGADCDENIRKIGRADDLLKQRGVSWQYSQQKWANNPRAYGVKIVIHCAPRTIEP